MLMKKSMLLLACIISSFIHTMENNSWSIVYHGTRITITTGSLFDADNKVDLIVVGKNQQELLHRSTSDKLHDKLYSDLGRIEYSNNKTIYVRDKNSVNDTFQSNKQLWTDKQEMHTKVLSITEPIITNNSYLTTIILLTTCYAHVFEEGLKALSYKKEKRIAFPLLGSACGFSTKKPIEAATIGINTFIVENPQAYAVIELFVEKKSDVIRCRKLFKKLQNNLDEIRQKGY